MRAGKRLSNGTPVSTRSASGGLIGPLPASAGAMIVFCINDLQALRGARWKIAARLHRFNVFVGQRAAAQWLGQQIGRRDRILDCEVDADAANGAHRMRRVADAQQTRP